MASTSAGQDGTIAGNLPQPGEEEERDQFRYGVGTEETENRERSSLDDFGPEEQRIIGYVDHQMRNQVGLLRMTIGAQFNAVEHQLAGLAGEIGAGVASAIPQQIQSVLGPRFDQLDQRTNAFENGVRSAINALGATQGLTLQQDWGFGTMSGAQAAPGTVPQMPPPAPRFGASAPNTTPTNRQLFSTPLPGQSAGQPPVSTPAPSTFAGTTAGAAPAPLTSPTLPTAPTPAASGSASKAPDVKHIEKFTGHVDSPITLPNWLMKLELAFQIANTADEHKAPTAITCLGSPAIEWATPMWKAYQSSQGGWPWTAFKADAEAHFIPADQLHTWREEFFHLKLGRGKDAMQEYIRLHDLYAMRLPDVSEAVRIYQFKAGLMPFKDLAKRLSYKNYDGKYKELVRDATEQYALATQAHTDNTVWAGSNPADKKDHRDAGKSPGKLPMKQPNLPRSTAPGKPVPVPPVAQTSWQCRTCRTNDHAWRDCSKNPTNKRPAPPKAGDKRSFGAMLDHNDLVATTNTKLASMVHNAVKEAFEKALNSPITHDSPNGDRPMKK